MIAKGQGNAAISYMRKNYIIESLKNDVYESKKFRCREGEKRNIVLGLMQIEQNGVLFCGMFYLSLWILKDHQEGACSNESAAQDRFWRKLFLKDYRS